MSGTPEVRFRKFSHLQKVFSTRIFTPYPQILHLRLMPMYACITLISTKPPATASVAQLRIFYIMAFSSSETDAYSLYFLE